MTHHRLRTRRRTRHRLAHMLAQALRRMRRVWHAHGQDLRSKSAYAQAISDAAAQISTQHRVVDVLIATMTGALAVHRARHRGDDQY